jgi:hypothetical protein
VAIDGIAGLTVLGLVLWSILARREEPAAGAAPR